jgi:enolase-phosphatase E1
LLFFSHVSLLGELQGEVFAEVPKVLKSWQASGIQVCVLLSCSFISTFFTDSFQLAIYSSGSIEAQKLLFGHTKQAGDMLSLFSAHFDTTSGPKIEATSYTKIAADLNVEPRDILFLTDIPLEAVAAKKAGYGEIASLVLRMSCFHYHLFLGGFVDTLLLTRPGNKALTDQDKKDFATVDDFNEVNKHVFS